MSLEENIKKWVLLDNDIHNLSQKIKNLKNEKSTYNDQIIEYITQQNLHQATIKISDGKLKFIDTNQSQALSYKFIYECLESYLNNEKEALNIMKFIKNKRNIKTTTEIKRFHH